MTSSSNSAAWRIQGSRTRSTVPGCFCGKISTVFPQQSWPPERFTSPLLHHYNLRRPPMQDIKTNSATQRAYISKRVGLGHDGANDRTVEVSSSQELIFINLWTRASADQAQSGSRSWEFSRRSKLRVEIGSGERYSKKRIAEEQGASRRERLHAEKSSEEKNF
ncbi:hypothetical protein GQ44DRAFT_452113 [Phaeosphaeriaceae sp. PMI808]|nr:hypothetical protein GQ44DRAFT_452113 [Phaeosphaeriaceae sp. PMI808]